MYKFALENTAKEENVRELNKEYIAFEKRHGNRCVRASVRLTVRASVRSTNFGMCCLCGVPVLVLVGQSRYPF